MKILHFADTHVRDKDIEECRKVLKFIATQAKEIKPDLIIHAGDVFDSQNIKLDSASAKLVFEIFSDMARVAPVIIVVGTPSHEGLAIEVARHIKSKYPIHVSTRPEQLYIVLPVILTDPPPNDLVGICDAVVSCLPAPTKQFFQNGSITESDQAIGDALPGILAGFAAGAAYCDAPHVLAGHVQVGGAFVSTGQQLIGREIEVSRAQIDAANADLVCLGHIHKPQKIGDNVFYSGSTYRLNYGELEAKGFYVHFIDSVTGLGKSDFIETPTRKLVKHAMDLTGGASIATLMMEGARFSGDAVGAEVKLEISVYEDEADQLSQEVFKEAFEGASSVDIQIIRIPRENVRSGRIMKLESLKDKIVERAAIAREEVGPSILAKADQLESRNPDQIFNDVSAA